MIVNPANRKPKPAAINATDHFDALFVSTFFRNTLQDAIIAEMVNGMSIIRLVIFT